MKNNVIYNIVVGEFIKRDSIHIRPKHGNVFISHNC